MDPSDSAPPQAQSHGHDNPDTSDLMGSAKVLAEAAKSTFSHEPADKVDRARVADAASDLLDAASHYGKLEDKSYGKYVEKAEDYLRQYGSADPSAADASQLTEAPAHAAEPHRSEAQTEDAERPGSGGGGDYLKMAQGFLGSGGEEKSGSGGGGDYLKMAQGFLGSGGEEKSGSGGGSGDFVKMAKGFLNK